MAVVHVGAINRRVDDRDDVLGRATGGWFLMGTWLDEPPHDSQWQSTLGKPRWHHDYLLHWGGATYTIEHLPPRKPYPVIPFTARFQWRP